MKRRLIQWGICSGIVALVSLLGLMLFDREVFSIFEPLLRPWFELCRAITPDAWEVQGNILLGLMWMVTGVLVCCILFGAIATVLLSAIEGWRNKSAAKGVAAHLRSRVPFGLCVVGIVAVVLVFFLILVSRPPVENTNPAKGRPKPGDVWKDETGSGPVVPEEAVSDVGWRLTLWTLNEEDYFDKHMEVHASLSSGLTFKSGRSQRDGWPHYEDGHDWYAFELTRELAASLRQSLPQSPLVENVPHLLNEIPGIDGNWPKTWPEGTTCYATVDRAGSWACLIISPQGSEAWFYREAH